MAEWLFEPGIVAVVIMLAATTIHAVGALWAREDYLRLATVAMDVAEDPCISDEEKKDLALNVQIATSWYVGPVMFIGLPIMVVYLTMKAALIALSGQRVTEASLLGSFKQQSKYADAVNKPIWKSRPLFVIWAVLWLLPLLIMLALTHGSTNLVGAIVNRGPLSMFSRLAHR